MRTSVSALISIIALSFSAWGGGKTEEATEPVDLSTLPAIIDPATVTVSQAVIDQGKRVYTRSCLACHMADGRGMPGMQPSLIGSEKLAGDPYVLIDWVLRGSDALGGAPSKWPVRMLPHDHLSNQQVAAVVSYTRNAFGDGASGVSPEMVSLVRGE